MPADRISLTLNDTAPRRFWAKVDKTGDCWLWTARLSRDGYGQFRTGGVGTPNARAHRVAWALAYGAIPEGLLVLHRCDNPRCVRPEHLFLGTSADNVADRNAKGRQATGARLNIPCDRGRGHRNPRYTHPETTARGERNGHARFTAEQVLEIRRLWAAGGMLQRDIAAQFGTDQAVVSLIVRRKTWAHLPNEQDG
jgi:hypothetical protein